MRTRNELDENAETQVHASVSDRWASRTFLTDTAKVVGAPRSELTQRLDAMRSVDQPGLRALFVAANYVALLLFRSGRADLAREMCRSEIELAVHPRHRRSSLHLALDPQLNIARMDAKTGLTDEALRVLELLHSILTEQQVAFESFEWRRADASSLEAPVLRQAMTALRNACVIETSRLLWASGRLHQLRVTARRARSDWPAAASGVLFHAHEAEVLLDPETAFGSRGGRGGTYSPEADRVVALPAASRLVLALHRAAWSADAGSPRDAREALGAVVEMLAEVRGVTLACPSTVASWEEDLAASMLTLGMNREAGQVLESAMEALRRAPDGSVITRVLRLSAQAFPDATPPVLDGATALDHEEVTAAANEVMDRLASTRDAS